MGETGTGPVAVVTYGNGHYLARQAAAQMPGMDLRVIDLRWLVPLPLVGLALALQGVGHVLFVDECRQSGNVSEALMTWGAEAGAAKAGGAEAGLPRMARLTAEDSFIATGPAYAATLPSVAGIVAALQRLVQQGAGGA